MHRAPTNAIEALSFLLQQWVYTVFPEQNRDVATLNHLWMSLAEALCGSHKSKITAFQREITQLRSGARAGDPPHHALEQRLHELVEAGLQEFFLVIAVRQAIQQLISTEFPSTLVQWKQLADDILPLQVQFAHKPDEMPGSSAILEPNV